MDELEFNLDDIIKEFSDAPEEVSAEEKEEASLEEVLEETEGLFGLEDGDTRILPDISEVEAATQEAPAVDDSTRVLPDLSEAPAPVATQTDSDTRVLPDLSQVVPAEKEEVTSDTIRLDVIDGQHLQGGEVAGAQHIDDEARTTVDPFTAAWEPEYDQPMGEYVPPQPIAFPSRSRMRELKRKLVEGPEKMYYALLEKGLGKLQASIFFSLLVVLLSAGSTALYALGWVQPDRMKLMIFSQFLAMLVSALLGSNQLIEGIADMLKKRFSIHSMLVFTFVACCFDGVLCLVEGRVPCCAAFSLVMTMSLWSAYHKRYVRLGQLDTMRKANRLDGVGVTEEYYEGAKGFLRFEGQVEDFTENCDSMGAPDKRINRYSVVAVLVSLAIGIGAGVLGFLSGGVTTAVSNGIQVLAVTMLAAVPACAFVATSRPFALLERRLHQLGAVICGWKGVKALCGKAYFPLTHSDLFPAGSMKMNGVKFYGSRLPDEIMAYCTAVIDADGSGLAPLFTQLLEARNGMHFDVQEMRAYENGGIGGLVEDEAVLVGSLSFLKEMGVEIPEGIRVNNAVCVAIDGELCGLFAITYEKARSVAAGLTTLCSYRGLKPVMTGADFMLTEDFIHSKFGVNTRRMAFPERQDQETLAQVKQEEGSPAAVLVTAEGLAPVAFGITGARALNRASNAGVVLQMIGGIIGMGIVLTLTVIGALDLLAPVNMFLYHLVWMIPGLLITEWTRSI